MDPHPIHDLANIVAMASEQEQLALTNDMKSSGQRDPAVLWKGEIVDGRCRQLACMTLNVPLQTRSLDDNLSEEEVAAIVKSLNTRRNLTMTQKVVSAYKQQIRTKQINKDIAMQWAISVPTLKNCKYIAAEMPEVIDQLFNGKSVTVYSASKGLGVTTNRINTLAKIIKDNKDIGSTVDNIFEADFKYSVEELPMSHVMHKWYVQKLSEYERITDEGKNMMVKSLLVELSKYKEVKGEHNS